MGQVVGFVRNRPTIWCAIAAVGSGLSVAETLPRSSMSTRSITVREITALNHEVVNHTVERCVVKTSHGSEELKVHGCDWAFRMIQLDRNITVVPTHFEHDEGHRRHGSGRNAIIVSVV